MKAPFPSQDVMDVLDAHDAGRCLTCDVYMDFTVCDVCELEALAELAQRYDNEALTMGDLGGFLKSLLKS